MEGDKRQGANLARGPDESSTGGVRKYKPEGQIIPPGPSDTLTVVSKTDHY